MRSKSKTNGHLKAQNLSRLSKLHVIASILIGWREKKKNHNWRPFDQSFNLRMWRKICQPIAKLIAVTYSCFRPARGREQEAGVGADTNLYLDCSVQMKSASASWFDLEQPGERVTQSLNTEEFLWWTAAQEKRKAWQAVWHHHLR